MVSDGRKTKSTKPNVNYQRGRGSNAGGKWVNNSTGQVVAKSNYESDEIRTPTKAMYAKPKPNRAKPTPRSR